MASSAHITHPHINTQLIHHLNLPRIPHTHITSTQQYLSPQFVYANNNNRSPFSRASTYVSASTVDPATRLSNPLSHTHTHMYAKLISPLRSANVCQSQKLIGNAYNVGGSNWKMHATNADAENQYTYVWSWHVVIVVVNVCLCLLLVVMGCVYIWITLLRNFISVQTELRLLHLNVDGFIGTALWIR